MFQSNGNLFGNSSSYLSIHQLKKILRIPQDQLNKLNNIPGWGSCEKTLSETSTVLPNKENNKISCEKYTSKKQNSLNKTDFDTSNCTKLVNIVKEKPASNIFNSEEEFLFFDSEKPSFSKSLSLNSLNIESSQVNKKIKRSSSFPNMERGLAQEFELNSKFLQKKGDSDFAHEHNIEKCYFMDSAVQCKMSQSSQPVFEMPLSERVEFLSANNEKVIDELKLPSVPNANVLKTGLKGLNDIIEDLKPLSHSKISENKMEVNKEENVTLLSKKESSVETFSKNITNEESFVSQAVPCAQPCSADIVRNDVVLTSDQKVTASISEVPLADPPNNLSVKSKLTTKRKRYNKSERDSKKLKSLPIINIEYSSGQIKNMIELMKLFNKL